MLPQYRVNFTFNLPFVYHCVPFFFVDIGPPVIQKLHPWRIIQKCLNSSCWD